MTNLTQNIEIPNKTTESRRSFLTRLGMTAIAFPVLVKAKTSNFIPELDLQITDQEFENCLSGMIYKFDRLSAMNKRRMIQSLDHQLSEIENQVPEISRAYTRAFLNKTKLYFEKRLEAI